MTEQRKQQLEEWINQSNDIEMLEHLITLCVKRIAALGRYDIPPLNLDRQLPQMGGITIGELGRAILILIVLAASCRVLTNW